MVCSIVIPSRSALDSANSARKFSSRSGFCPAPSHSAQAPINPCRHVIGLPPIKFRDGDSYFFVELHVEKEMKVVLERHESPGPEVRVWGDPRPIGFRERPFPNLARDLGKPSEFAH